MIHIAADDTGLFVIYPSQDDLLNSPDLDGYVINKINPIDLRILNSWSFSLPR